MDQIKKNNIAYAKLLNKCWDDPAYLEKFRADPAAALKEFGIPTPPNARYHIVAPQDMKPSTKEDVYLYYMDKPEVTSLNDETLSKVAGGVEPKPEPEPHEPIMESVDVLTHVEVGTEVVAEVVAVVMAVVLIIAEGTGAGDQ